jgi:hypothetical protein
LLLAEGRKFVDRGLSGRYEECQRQQPGGLGLADRQLGEQSR